MLDRSCSIKEFDNFAEREPTLDSDQQPSLRAKAKDGSKPAAQIFQPDLLITNPRCPPRLNNHQVQIVGISDALIWSGASAW